MGQHSRRETFPSSAASSTLSVSPPAHGHPQQRQQPRADNLENDHEIVWPFGKLTYLDRDDIRETAYEIFFTACRSSPGFGGRNAISFYSSHENGDGSGSKSNGVVMSPTSRLKRALGLKMLRRSPSKRMVSGGSNGGSGSPSYTSSPLAVHSTNTTGMSPSLSFNITPARPRRPMTSAEIMRQQMRVTEQSDNRLRKSLTRTLVGQTGRRAETIVLPLELLRHLKPSEFNDSTEYHFWQKRQLKVLEAGLILHPSVPLEKTNTFAMRLREIIRSSERKPIDTIKNVDTMRTLCNSVVSLCWRSANGTPSDDCHWADGFPLNINLYVALLQSIFDIRDETLVLDEVDELLELMKKTWSTLGITRPIHNVCFTWVLFHQYVVTAQMETDLLCAAHAMLSEVANDACKPDREPMYVKILSSVFYSMLGWIEKKLLHYHDCFQRGCVGQIEKLLPLALSASRILGEDVTIAEGKGEEEGNVTLVDASGDRIDHYIRSSVKNAFTKIIDNEEFQKAMNGENEAASEALLRLAKETEGLALKERESYSPVLKKWHPNPAAVAAVTLHHCYGNVLKQYLGGVSTLTGETAEVLQRAAKLEKVLVQMVVEDSSDCEDGGKGIVREMIPYEVDSVIMTLLSTWIDETLRKNKDCLNRAKETETWNPKSKTEPYAQSAVELMKLAKQTVEEFFEIPVNVTEELVNDLADGLENLIQDYITFVAACGSKQSYIPPLPPLTRCNTASKFIMLWKKTTPCSAVTEDSQQTGVIEGHQPRQSTSRGTQRLYIRLNTLHYLLEQSHALDKLLSTGQGIIPSPRYRLANNRRGSNNYSYFEHTYSSIQAGSQNISEVAAYRLIFHDSRPVFYEGLYLEEVANARIHPALRSLQQNLNLLTSILTDRAQAMAVKEVMKATVEAFLMVLLAGGTSRVYYRSDHQMIEEDFESLKKVFSTCGEGLVSEDIVEKEGKVLEGVIALFGQSTEQLIEDFSILTCETDSGAGVLGSGKKLPVPQTTGRWNRTDPNTILRILCHRNDRVANQFLKRTFQLAKRT